MNARRCWCWYAWHIQKLCNAAVKSNDSDAKCSPFVNLWLGKRSTNCRYFHRWNIVLDVRNTALNKKTYWATKFDALHWWTDLTHSFKFVTCRWWLFLLAILVQEAQYWNFKIYHVPNFEQLFLGLVELDRFGILSFRLNAECLMCSDCLHSDRCGLAAIVPCSWIRLLYAVYASWQTTEKAAQSGCTFLHSCQASL